MFSDFLIKYLPLSRTINQRLSGYYQTMRESERILVNGEKWIDITPFLDYFLEIMEESMITSMKEEHDCRKAFEFLG